MADYMSKAEFSRAIDLLEQHRENETINFDCLDKFNGFGLHGFEPVICTLDELAMLIAWQCLQFNGAYDAEALDEIWQYRRKFLIVGRGSDESVQRTHDRLQVIRQLDQALEVCS